MVHADIINTKFHRYANYTISADEELSSPKRISQHTRLPELILLNKPNSPFVCQDCISNSTYPPIIGEENDTASNVYTVCGILIFCNTRERRSFNACRTSVL